MAQDARRYLEEFDWCPPITDMALAYGIGGVIALFRVDFARIIEGSPDKTLWTVVGDLPSAYFVHEGIETPRAALEAYCRLMEDWAQAVKKGQDLDEEFPVDAKPTAQNADDLLGRLAVIRGEFLDELD